MEMQKGIGVIILGVVSCLTPSLSKAENEGVDLNKLYRSGVSAFSRNEYIQCVENFTKFKIYGKEYLKTNPKISKGVDERLAICEKKIATAMNFYNSQHSTSMFSGSNSLGSSNRFRANGVYTPPK